jgi:hypothetical protein
MKSETPSTSAAIPVSGGEEKATRRPYVAPAIDSAATIEPVTLGTKPRNLAGHGC